MNDIANQFVMTLHKAYELSSSPPCYRIIHIDVRHARAAIDTSHGLAPLIEKSC
ncbi:hypothetical protein W911_08000 [Hyphomicrobium nitrativorans NL23]|uniref:Uncharacterized protein n=1 Tax=Hyphomicrobium nitrativorans NL23 TaxID=1029756 RepID=V5SGU4_9HYPH|nr:hypothetical protein W911_08000 [Hyphomicrobium nitrativorans NL23]